MARVGPTTAAHVVAMSRLISMRSGAISIVGSVACLAARAVRVAVLVVPVAAVAVRGVAALRGLRLRPVLRLDLLP